MQGFALKVELARGAATRHGCALVKICRGPAKGCATPRSSCKSCYQVDERDERSTVQILRDMERGNG